MLNSEAQDREELIQDLSDEEIEDEALRRGITLPYDCYTSISDALNEASDYQIEDEYDLRELHYKKRGEKLLEIYQLIRTGDPYEDKLVCLIYEETGRSI